MTDASSSAWRTAYISTLFEKDAVKLAVRIVEARLAINERLNSLVEIGATEQQALEVARQALLGA